MTSHMNDNVHPGRPVCFDSDRVSEPVLVVSIIDQVDCVDCLRRLAKDAVMYGNQRRAKKGTW